jgi:Ca2+-binding RTX toxin-like protein
MARIRGTRGDDELLGFLDDDRIRGLAGDDTLFGREGRDKLYGEDGFDVLHGGIGNDKLFGGRLNDNLYGEGGDDYLTGDVGSRALKGSDLGADNLNGGSGNDTLAQGDGNDFLSGGGGKDVFAFKWSDPATALAAGTGPAFATLTDFDPLRDTLTFDVAGLKRDAVGANFLDGGAGDGFPGGEASSFFAGDAALSAGESVMVLTGTGFATGLDAVAAAQGEAEGDLVIYFNTTVNVASLLYVDGANAAHSIARFANIDSLQDLQDADFRADDFLFV